MIIKVRMKNGAELTFTKPVSRHISRGKDGSIEKVIVVASPMEGVTNEVEICGRYIESVEVEE